MSQRAPYPHGSPTIEPVRTTGLHNLLDPDPPARSLINRQLSYEDEPSKPRLAPTEDIPPIPQRSRNAEKQHGERSTWKSRPLAAILGRRRRWQRYMFFCLCLVGVYLYFRPRQPKAPTTGLSKPGQSRRKTKPLHLRASSPVRASVPASVVLQSRSEHEIRNGLLEVDMTSKIHPLYQLIRDAREEWDEKVATQSMTLQAAVEEYRRRNGGRMPPKGFDKWWAYVVDNNVRLPDEYDQINRDLRPFRALSPRQLEQRLEDAATLRDTYTIRVKSGSIRTSVNFNTEEPEIDGARMRLEGQVDLLGSVAQHLPDFKAVYTVHDTADRSISWNHRMELEDNVVDGEYLDEEDELDISLRGWATACPQSARIREGPNIDPIPSHSFISSHRSAMDLCEHPDLIPIHGLLAGKDPHHGPLIPLFCLSKTTLHSDILGVPTEQWSGNVPYVSWEDKLDDRLLWRGSNTGSVFSASTPWRSSHRIRLIELGMELQGAKEMLPLPKNANGRGSLAPLAEGMWEMDKERGNTKYMDMHFTGSPLQCNVDDGTCAALEKTFYFVERMTHDDALLYKYVLDVDGNAWSARFQRLLASGSLIFKATVTPEWWTDRIQPWVHYIPIKMDYSDLYDSLAFFSGDINGQNGEPLLAKQIAAEGKEWVDTHWRKEDMTAYVFRLYLEWARLLAPNKAEADFVFEESMERNRS